MTTNKPTPQDNVSSHGRPSDLRITDMRTATVGWNNWRFTIIRIDTNQGISGYGEVRDGASKTFALMLKSRLIGENPCDVDRLFRKIKQFGHHARQGGGVCAVEMALMDLAGKAYGVPAFMIAGGKFRDSIRMYCDTPNEPTGEAMGKKIRERIDKGFSFVKMDVGIGDLIDVPGALSFPPG
ncbi:MAG: mandelate racemase/muconate lactonizing enzyme family protein, partial [Chloroflexota bacterium]